MLVATEREMQDWVRRMRSQIARGMTEASGQSCFCLARASSTGDVRTCGGTGCAVWSRLEER